MRSIKLRKIIERDNTWWSVILFTDILQHGGNKDGITRIKQIKRDRLLEVLYPLAEQAQAVAEREEAEFRAAEVARQRAAAEGREPDPKVSRPYYHVEDVGTLTLEDADWELLKTLEQDFQYRKAGRGIKLIGDDLENASKIEARPLTEILAAEKAKDTSVADAVKAVDSPLLPAKKATRK